MTQAQIGNPVLMDPALLARLTGALGEDRHVAKICETFGQLYTEFLPGLFQSETNIIVHVAYLGCETGPVNALVTALGDNYTITSAALRNWSTDFRMACNNSFVITLMENLLGAMPETIEQPIERPLSKIELDLAAMVFEKIAGVLRSGVNAAGGFDVISERPINAEDRSRKSDVNSDFASAIRMGITLGSISSDFVVIVPHKALLKTVVTLPKAGNQSGRGSKDWTDQISEQVRRSQVTLEARIRLQSLTLRTISKLMEGDVIPFMETDDVHVDISANGKEMYVCEFGRSGEKYTVRVKDNVSTDDEILQHLMG